MMREYHLLRNFCSFDEARIHFTEEVARRTLRCCLPQFAEWLDQIGCYHIKAYDDGRSIATLTIEYTTESAALFHHMTWAGESNVEYRSLCFKCRENSWFAVQDRDTFKPVYRALGLLLFRT